MSARLRRVLGLCVCVAALLAARPSGAAVPATVNVSGGVAGLAAGHTGPAFTVSLSQPVASGLTINLVLTGEGFPGSSVSPSTLVFGPGESLKTFTLTAGLNLGNVFINYSLTGPDASNYVAPAPNVVAIKAPMQAFVPGSVPRNGIASGSVSVSQVPIQGDLIVSISLAGPGAAGSSVSPSVATLTEFNGSMPFTITGGSTPGEIILTFSVSGTAAAKHAAPGPRTVQVTAPITVTGPAVVPRSSTSSPFTVTLGLPAPKPLTVHLIKTGVVGTTLSTNALNFAPGETTKTFTIDTLHLGGPLGVLFSLSGDGAVYYQSPSAFSSWVETRIRINISSSTIPRNTSRAFTVSLDRVAQAPITVTLSLSGDGAAGSSLSQSVVEFAAGTAFKFVTLQAGPNIGSLVISGVSSGPDAMYSSAPEPATQKVVAFTSMQGGTGPTANEAPVTFSLVLSIPAPGPVTATLSASGAAGPGITLSPATLSFAAGETTKTFTIAGTTIGTATITATLSGPGAEFLLGTNRLITVAGRATISGQPASMPVSSTTSDITVTLPIPSPTAFTLSIGLTGPAAPGSSVATSPLSFAAGDVSKTFTVTSGTTSGTLIVFFTPSNNLGGTFRFSSFAIQVIAGAPTAVGSNVSVTPPAIPGVSSSVNVTFAEVTGAGSTRLLAVSPGSQFPPPSGFEVPGSPFYFGVSTTAQVIGPVTVCSSYPDGAAADETSLRIFVRISGAWVDVTSAVDAGANVICGELASLDPAGALLAVFRPNAASSVGAISGPTLVEAGAASEFTAVVSDPDAADVLQGVWQWGDGTTSPATIEVVDGVQTAKGTHAFSAAGTFTVTLVITDGATPVRSADHDVTVDAAPPVISAVTATPDLIWPPDNKMHAVTVTVEATDDSGMTPVCAISKVEISADKAPGLDGEYDITGPLTLTVRAAMFRVYTITITCTDAVDRTSVKTVTVKVAKEQ